MQKIISIFFILFSIHSGAQNLKLENEKYIMEKVDTTTLTKYQIYEKARNWMVRTLKSSDSNILLNDTSKSQLTSTGNLFLDDIYYTLTCVLSNVTINYKITILAKENRYKVIFDNMTLSNTTVCYRSNGNTSRQYHEYPLEKLGLSDKKRNKILKEIEDKLTKVYSDLNQTLNDVNLKKSDDW